MIPQSGRISDQVKATHAGLGRIFHFEKPGLYFLPISGGIINKRTEHLIRGFFLAINGEFSGIDSDPVTARALNAELVELFKTADFKDEFQGIPIELGEVLIGDDSRSVRYKQKDPAGGFDKEVPDLNLTFHQFYRFVCVLNNLVYASESIIGFVFDAARLDERMLKRFSMLLRHFRERIEKSRHIIYFFFSDTPDHTFSESVLYGSEEFHRIGKIAQEGVVPFPPFAICRDSLVRIASVALKAHSPLIFFLGAGTSKQAGMPTGPEILDYALKELLGNTYSDKETAVREVIRRLGNPPWLSPDDLTSEHVISLMSETNANYLHTDTFRWLKECDKNAEPKESHQTLVRYCLEQGKSILLTTNFDTVIDRVDQASLRVVFRDEEFKTVENLTRSELFDTLAKDKKVGLVKLHGSLEAPQTIALKIEQLKDLSSPKSTFWERLFKPLYEEAYIPVLIVGYSFHDPDLIHRFEELGNRGFQVIVVTREPTWRMWEVADQPARDGARGMIRSVNFELLTDCLANALKN